MASPALPVISPFETTEADERYIDYYEKGNILRVPHKHHERKNELPKLESKVFNVKCVGNYKSLCDIVFSSFGWAAVTSRPEVEAKIRAFTISDSDCSGLIKREPSLLPFIVNMRKKWSRTDGSQGFKSVLYKKRNDSIDNRIINNDRDKEKNDNNQNEIKIWN
jgi:hypothetical protein